MSKLKAVLFDLDGTLRDTRKLIYASLDHTFVSLGLPSPTRGELAPYIHHHSFVHAKFAADIDFAEFEGVYRQKVAELLPAVELYKQAEQTLHDIHAKGYKVAIVTAAPRASEWTKENGIGRYLDVLIGGNDITKHKPDPEGLQLALKRLGLSSEQVVYVGDLVTDAQAAQAAGLKAFIGITHGFATRAELEAAGADYLIDSLDELLAVLEKFE